MMKADLTNKCLDFDLKCKNQDTEASDLQAAAEAEKIMQENQRLKTYEKAAAEIE